MIKLSQKRIKSEQTNRLKSHMKIIKFQFLQ